MSCTLLLIVYYMFTFRHYFILLEMQTVIKQAICVNVLQMCCNYENKQR